MSYARYLMLDPKSYELEHQQLFNIEECQFCKGDNFTYQRFLPSHHLNSNYNKGILWVQRCVNCKKTVSTVKRRKAS